MRSNNMLWCLDMTSTWLPPTTSSSFTSSYASLVSSVLLVITSLSILLISPSSTNAAFSSASTAVGSYPSPSRLPIDIEKAALAKHHNALRNITNFIAFESVRCSTPMDLYNDFPVLKSFTTAASLSQEFETVIARAFSFANIVQKYANKASNSYFRTLLASMRQSQGQLLHGVGVCRESSAEHSTADSSSSVLSAVCKMGKGLLQNRPLLTTSHDTRLPVHVWAPPKCGGELERSNKFPLRLFLPLIQYNHINISKPSDIIFFEFDVRNVTLNQCLESRQDNVCHKGTTKCEFDKDRGRYKFQMGNYFCKCQDRYYEERYHNRYPGALVEEAFRASLNVSNISKDVEEDGVDGQVTPYEQMECYLCKFGCDTCTSPEPCVLNRYDGMMYTVALTVQSFSITGCVFLGLLVFKYRKCRAIKCSNWFMSEIFLLGAILLYASIVPMRFPPDTVTCLSGAWLRELGFATMYGTLLVKVYRVLSGFQNRKAHRVHVRDKDVLRILGLIILLAVVHMLSWSAVNVDHLWGGRNSTLNESGHLWGQPNVTFMVCRAFLWDALTEILELAVVVVALCLCRTASSPPSEYGELGFITAAFGIEAAASCLLHLLRHMFWYRVHPDYFFWAYFLRCHATVTTNVFLIFAPKFWYIYRPPSLNGSRGRLAMHASGGGGNGGGGGFSGRSALLPNGDLDVEHLNLAEMDPKDIRRELKKLYTNLELLRTKAMRKDNPHISRRRGGRKQRRFSMQPFHKKHQLSGNVSVTIRDDDVSKVSEDSISVEESQAVLS